MFDFLTTIRPLASSFADVWLELYQARKLKGEALPELPEVIEMFRNYQRLVDTSESNTSRATFDTSFQGKTIKDTPASEQSKSQKPTDEPMVMMAILPTGSQSDILRSDQ